MKKFLTILFSAAVILSLASCSKKPAKTITYTKEKNPIGEKAAPDSVGDILFSDGTATAWEDGKTLNPRQKQHAIAVIFYVGTECSDDGRERVLGIGLVHEGKTHHSWADEDSKIYDKNIEPIQCEVSGEKGHYSFEGNLDGTENFKEIKDFLKFIDEDDTEEEFSYQAFKFAQNYGEDRESHLIGTPYKDGWYLPSIAELYKLWEEHETVFAALSACNGDSKYNKMNFKRPYYCSSSLFPFNNESNRAYEIDFEEGKIQAASNFAYACAIRDFRTAPGKEYEVRQYENPAFAPFYQFRKLRKGMYVDSKAGLTVRKQQGLDSERRCDLNHGDYVLLEELGEEVTIDGITSAWVKILLPRKKWADAFEREYGWVFGGYLKKDSPLSYNEILSYIEDNKYYEADFFPKNDNDGNTYISDYTGWRWESSYNTFDLVLENYCCENYKRTDAVTIQDCLFYQEAVAADPVGALKIIPAGTKVKVSCVIGYGGNMSTLYPLYYCDAFYEEDNITCTCEGIIRGLDITSRRNISKVSDGNGGSMSVVYQQALSACNSGISNAPHAGKDGWVSPSRKEIDETLNSYIIYDEAELQGGYRMLAANYIDNNGKSYKLEIETDGRLSLAYPLNMEHPIPFLEDNQFHGGMGGGNISKIIYTIEVKDNAARLGKILEYVYCDTDGGPSGTGYHYYGKDGLYHYIYQVNEYGDAERNEWSFNRQDKNNLYRFNYKFADDNDEWTRHCEPQGKSHILKEGDYATTICRLKIRTSQSADSSSFYTFNPGTLVKVVEEGKNDTIDGLKSNWVLVQEVNDESLKEGESNTNADGWVFAAYLE